MNLCLETLNFCLICAVLIIIGRESEWYSLKLVKQWLENFLILRVQQLKQIASLLRVIAHIGREAYGKCCAGRFLGSKNYFAFKVAGGQEFN